MRSELRHRVAPLLGLLLLVHLGSGLLHPCCLGGAGEHVGMHVEAEHAAVPATGHGAGMHEAGAHDGGSHVTASLQRAADHEAAAAGHGSDHPRGPDDCEGPCGLCCSTVDQVVVAGPSGHADRSWDAVSYEVTRLQARVLPPAPAFLLPLANAPPGASILLG